VIVGSAFEFATATRIVFGAGRVAEVPGWLREQELRSVLLVTGRDTARSHALAEGLAAAGIAFANFAIAGEPSVEQARAGAARCRELGVDAVVALGGGSALDGGKAIAALAANPGDVLDYLEVIGKAQPLPCAPLPFVAVPTTAGTGAEVTRNAVLGSHAHGVKASLRSPLMLPRLAVVDPDFLRDAPAAVIRASGLDALSQLIEPLVSSRATPLSDALARDGLVRSRRSLRAAVLQGTTADMREDLALASLYGGLCLANSGLGAVHGFAAPVGGSFEAPHGAVCASLLPHVMNVNVRALSLRDAEGRGLQRYAEVARLLTSDEHARPEDGAAWVHALCRDLNVPGLSAYGVRAEHVEDLVGKAARASSMKGNPVALTDEELREILTLSL
jgi:alcohol dehydrogenase class IV